MEVIKRKVTGVTMVLMVLFSFFSCVADDEFEGGANLQVGDSIPNFSVVTNNGQEVKSSDWKLNACTVIVFFNTKCPDCKKELPVLQQLYENSPCPFEVLCISRKENAESVSNYWKTNHLTLPFSAQNDAYIYKLFASSGIPRVYVVDKNLTIRYVFTDNPIADYEQLRNAVCEVAGT